MKFFIATASVILLWVNGCCEPLPSPKTIADSPSTAETKSALAPNATEPKLVVLNDSTAPTVTFSIVFATGSSSDPADLKGLSYLSAHLMSKSGTHALSYTQFLESLFPMAASFDVHVGRDQTVFSGTVHRDHTDEYYEMFVGALLNTKESAPDLKRIRNHAIHALTKELRGGNNEELGKAALMSTMFDGHPYAAPPLGTVRGLRAIRMSDIIHHKRNNFCRERMTIGVAGPKAQSLAARMNEDLRALSSSCIQGAKTPKAPPLTGRRMLIVEKPAIEVTAISIGFPIDVDRSHPDYAACKLIEAYFGQHRTFSGQLQKSLRTKRGLNYGNYAYLEHFEQDGRSRLPMSNTSLQQQYFSIWIRPVRDSERHFALRLAIRELKQLVEEGLTKEEFEKNRQFVKRYYKTFSMSQPRRLGYAMDNIFYQTEGNYQERLFRNLDALTLEDVNKAVKTHLTNTNIHIAAVTSSAIAFANDVAEEKPSPISYRSDKSSDILFEDKKISTYALGIPRKAITVIPAGKIFE